MKGRQMDGWMNKWMTGWLKQNKQMVDEQMDGENKNS